MTNEKIICAAIYVESVLFTGKNHGECFVKLKQSQKQGFIAKDIQGKIRFVDRVEALSIATNAGQTITKHAPFDQLLSEDLRDDNTYQKGMEQ